MILNVDLTFMEVKVAFKNSEVTLTAMTARLFDIQWR